MNVRSLASVQNEYLYPYFLIRIPMMIITYLSCFPKALWIITHAESYNMNVDFLF